MNKEAAAFLTKERYDFSDLCTVMKLLRAPGGCPWDREQTHASIRKNLIEETYEVVEAIDNADNVLLREELGDLLLQVVFHARMAEEEGAFDIGDVCDEICRKLIVRHPHIFSDVTASTAGEVLDNWDQIKRATKKQKSTPESMRSVSRALPSLMRAYKLGEKAAKTGFDFPDADSAADGLREELDELSEAVAAGDEQAVREETGDLLFAAVNVARKLGVDPEEALYRASDKFTDRFEKMESAALESGSALASLSFEQLEMCWEAVKNGDNRQGSEKNSLKASIFRQKNRISY